MSLQLRTPMLRAGEGACERGEWGVGYRNAVGGFLCVEFEKTSKVLGPWRGRRGGKFSSRHPA